MKQQTKQHEPINERDVIYDRQYLLKIPYFLVFFTWQGVLTLLFAILVTSSLISFTVTTLLLSYPLYKLFAPTREELENIFLIKIFLHVKDYIFGLRKKKR
jgi:hypothetical protein